MNTPPNDYVVQITTGTIVRAVLICLALYLCFVLSDVLVAILAAIVLASAIEPLTDVMTRRRVPRVIAVLVIYIFFFAFIATVSYLFLPSFLDELAGVTAQLPRYLDSLDVLGSPTLTAFLKSLVPVHDIVPAAQAALNTASGGVFQTAGALFGSLLNVFLIIVLSFYLAVQEKGIEGVLHFLVYEKHEAYVMDLWRRSRKKIGLWMQGQLLLGALIGIFAFLALTILGVRYALLLALISAVFEIIPVFGPIMSAVPAVAVGLSDSLFLGLMVLGFYIIIQQFENHLIYPLVVRKVVGVPPLLVIIALVVGGKLAGVLGILIAVPVASALMELVNDIEQKKVWKTTPST